jgi:hypothetical protein
VDIRYLCLCLLVACGSPGVAGDDYNPDTTYTAPIPSPTIGTTITATPIPAPCVSGTYYIQFQPSGQSIEDGFCSDTPTPAGYGITIGSDIPILNCETQIVSGDDNTCTYQSSSCIPVNGDSSFVWDGKIVFAHYSRAFVSVVNGNIIYSFYGGKVGVSAMVVNGGPCVFDVLIVPANGD